MPAVKDLIAQESHASKALGYPTGSVYYVNSATGANGNNGLSARHPFLTLTYALTIVAAGDTIVCEPGGSETVTATIAANVARVKIVCPARNPRSGYTISGAGTLDLMTVSAADVHVEGLRFAHTGATSSEAGILTTNAADRLTVVRCLFDDSAITTTFTGFGVESVGATDDVLIEDCTFLDCHRGVLWTVATGVICARPVIRRCTFYVGQATAFGLMSALTGTGIVQGLRVTDCLFMEAVGSGAVAAATWNGTNGADATRGPLKFEAAVDQFLVADCRAFTAQNVSFENLVNNAGVGDFVNNLVQATVVGSISAIYSDTTIIVSDTTAIHTQTTAIDSDITIIKSDTTAIHSDTTIIASDLVQVYSDTTIVVSDTTAVHSDTTAIHTQTTTIASDLVLMQAGYPIMLTGTKADIAGIPNNTQAAGGLLATATGGAVLIEDVVIAKDSTALTGPTNIELTTNNVYGPTGAADPIAVVAITALGANDRVGGTGTTTYTTLKFPVLLEATKALYIHGDDAAGTSAGNYQFTIIGRAQNASTTLV